MPITQERQQEIADGLSDIPQPKALNKRTLKGSKTMSANKIALLFLFVLLAGYWAGQVLKPSEEEWFKYLPTGQMTLAKAKMRICQDKAVCPNGYKDAASIKVYYPSAPEPAPASYIPPMEVEKMSMVPAQGSFDGPLTSHVNNTGKQLLGMLSSTIQRTQR
jgi:hypothetical protein